MKSELDQDKFLPIASKIPIFKDLSDPEIVKLLACAHKVRYGKDHNLFQSGDELWQFYILLKGHVQLLAYGTPVNQFQTVVSLGEVTCLLQLRANTTAKLLSTSIFLAFSLEKIKPMLDADIEFKSKIYYNASQILAEKVKNNNQISVRLNSIFEEVSCVESLLGDTHVKDLYTRKHIKFDIARLLKLKIVQKHKHVNLKINGVEQVVNIVRAGPSELYSDRFPLGKLKGSDEREGLLEFGDKKIKLRLTIERVTANGSIFILKGSDDMSSWAQFQDYVKY